MENNPDNELRDKLRGIHFPYDPKAWEQMEAMLEKERRPKGLFWWWFGSTAACLFFAASVVSYYHFAGKPGQGLNLAQHSNLNQPTSLNNIAAVSNENQHSNTAVATGNKRMNNKNLPLTVVVGSNMIKGSSQTGTRKKSEVRHRAEKLLKSSVANSNNQSANAGIPKVIEKSEIAHSISAANSTSFLEQISLTSMLPDELFGIKEENPGPVGINDDESLDIRKLKKKIFHYSLGASVNVTGTTLGKQTGGPFFYAKPSFMSGITHEFMFLNRFAVTNSILYSQTSFEVFQPKTSYPIAPANYTARISEIAIPIGVKAYIVSRAKFRFYATAGVINHVQLSETFNYTLITPPVINSSNNAKYGSYNPFPVQTRFNQVGHPVEVSTTFNSFQAPSPTAAEFAINQAHRYYASVYSTIGAEMIAQKHIVFFTEPIFFMSLNKIGIQDKYKYNLGLNSGIRYQF
jgi:hypothetical protein